MPCSLKCSPDINQCISLQSPKLFADLSSWLTERDLLLPPKTSQLHGKQLEAESLPGWLPQVKGGAPLPSAGWYSKAGNPPALEHTARQGCLSPLPALPVVPGCSTRAQLCLRISCCRAQGSQWESPQGAHWGPDQMFEAA